MLFSCRIASQSCPWIIFSKIKNRLLRNLIFYYFAENVFAIRPRGPWPLGLRAWALSGPMFYLALVRPLGLTIWGPPGPLR